MNSHYCTLQDAHEFLNFLLNELVDILEKEHNAARESLPNISFQKNSNDPIDGQPNGSHKELAATWVHKCFQVGFHSFVLACLSLWHEHELHLLLMLQPYPVDVTIILNFVP